MKFRFQFLLVCFLLGGVTPAVQAHLEHSVPFAVVELFTSEGCSSCPPADEFFNEISKEARETGQAIFPLAFHVDYWDRLGWKDPFSDSAYTQRQYAYAAVLRSTRVYTPQMVINGQAGFVGSNRNEAQAQIQRALAKEPQATVLLKVRPPEGSEGYQILYKVSPPHPEAVLNVALTEDGLVVEVTRGENAGRTLRHDGVVRAFKTVSLAEESQGTLALQAPDNFQGKGRMIAYLQDPATLEILGAAALPVESY